MFYDRDSMLEMYELSLKKTNWKHVLVTFEMLDDTITTKEMMGMLRNWRDNLKNVLSESDAAFEINAGNIFILLHEENQKTFDKSLQNFIIHSKSGKEGVSSSILYLSNEESEFLLKMNS